MRLVVDIFLMAYVEAASLHTGLFCHHCDAGKYIRSKICTWSKCQQGRARTVFCSAPAVGKMPYSAYSRLQSSELSLRELSFPTDLSVT